MNVIITGASRGIGYAIARKFAAEGYHLYLCSKNAAVLEQSAKAIQKEMPAINVKYKAADLSIKEETVSFAKWCMKQGDIDILINNAGQYLPGKAMDEPEGYLETMMNTNLFSAYHLTRKLLPAMIEKKKGHIFNICSVASLKPYDGGGGYSISKYALNGFSQNLRHELKNYGIKVTTVFPGAVLTDSWEGFDNSKKRIMEADDIAQIIVAATKLSPQAVVEDIILRPQMGDL